MPIQPVHLWAKNAGAGVGQWVAETIGIWQENGGLLIQQKDYKVRECVWEIAQSTGISNKLGTSPEQ